MCMCTCACENSVLKDYTIVEIGDLHDKYLLNYS